MLPLLIEGETGTGKSYLARWIHELGPRAGKPFVPQDCAALPQGVFESELFGHTRGAFTGAAQARRGLIEAAARGRSFWMRSLSCGRSSSQPCSMFSITAGFAPWARTERRIIGMIRMAGVAVIFAAAFAGPLPAWPSQATLQAAQGFFCRSRRAPMLGLRSAGQSILFRGS